MASTNKELVEVLLARPATPERIELIVFCQQNRFHCFKSKSATPKVDLVKALRATGDGDLAARAIDGEWDETPDAMDAEVLAREVERDSPAMAAAIRREAAAKRRS